MATLREAAWVARCVGRGDVAPFGPEEIARLAELVGTTEVAAGTPLMREGDPVDAVGVILRGEVELFRRLGIRRVVLQVLRDGDVFGDIPYFCHMPAPFHARALGPVTLVRLDAERVWPLLERHPVMCRRIIYSLASRLQRTQQRLLELTAGDLRRQVVMLLVDETGGGAGVVRMAQSTIAELLGASRPAVNRVLRELQDEGVVALGYRRIEVTDPDRLRAELARR